MHSHGLWDSMTSYYLSHLSQTFKQKLHWFFYCWFLIFSPVFQLTAYQFKALPPCFVCLFLCPLMLKEYWKGGKLCTLRANIHCHQNWIQTAVAEWQCEPQRLVSSLHRHILVSLTAERIVTLTRKRKRVMPVLNNMHWLPVKDHIDHKILSLAYNCFGGTAAQSFQELIPRCEPPQSLWLSSRSLLWVPSVYENHTKQKFRFRAFSPSLRHWESRSLFQLFAGNSRLVLFSNQWLHHHPSLHFFLCLRFPLFFIWQRNCPSMCHERGFSMDVWGLYKLTVFIIKYKCSSEFFKLLLFQNQAAGKQSEQTAK